MSGIARVPAAPSAAWPQGAPAVRQAGDESIAPRVSGPIPRTAMPRSMAVIETDMPLGGFLVGVRTGGTLCFERRHLEQMSQSAAPRRPGQLGQLRGHRGHIGDDIRSGRILRIGHCFPSPFRQDGDPSRCSRTRVCAAVLIRAPFQECFDRPRHLVPIQGALGRSKNKL
jgi:hypothetical protein